MDDKLTVVVLTNLAEAEPKIFADHVAEMYLSVILYYPNPPEAMHSPVRLPTAPLTPALENFGDLCGWSDGSYPEAVDRPSSSVFAALAVIILILAGAIYVLAFYLR